MKIENKKSTAAILLFLVLTFVSMAHATDYKAMAQSLLRESQQQITQQQPQINSILENSRKEDQMSSFDVELMSLEDEAFSKDLPKMKQGPTCSASSMSPGGKQKKAKYQGDSQLFVFVSLGMGDQNLKALASQAKELGAALVIRGLVDNSFIKTQKRLNDLGIPIDIDPTLFEKFDVKRVPTFVLAELKSGQLTGVCDKVKGNAPLASALDLFVTQGDLFVLAKTFLKRTGGC